LGVLFCCGNGWITPGVAVCCFFDWELGLKLIGIVKLPLLFACLSFSGVTSIKLAGRSRLSRAASSGAVARKERSDILLVRRRRPGRVDPGEPTVSLPALDGRLSCWDVDVARFSAVAAAAAERFD
jgi:hypothetical protein